MATLEMLIGRPLHEVSDEELEEIIMKGRAAREEGMASARTGGSGRKKSGAATSKKKSVLDDIDISLDDFE